MPENPSERRLIVDGRIGAFSDKRQRDFFQCGAALECAVVNACNTISDNNLLDSRCGVLPWKRRNTAGSGNCKRAACRIQTPCGIGTAIAVENRFFNC